MPGVNYIGRRETGHSDAVAGLWTRGGGSHPALYAIRGNLAASQLSFASTLELRLESGRFSAFMRRDPAIIDEHFVERHYTQGFSTATAETTVCEACGLERFAWVPACPSSRCRRLTAEA